MNEHTIGTLGTHLIAMSQHLRSKSDYEHLLSICEILYTNLSDKNLQFSFRIMVIQVIQQKYYQQFNEEPERMI